MLEQEVCGWINAKATIPVWAKMTPNITDITQPAGEALRAGCEGIAAINTITSVMGINLDTLRPEPTVHGHTTPGGYSCKAVKPIALAKVFPSLPLPAYTSFAISSSGALVGTRQL
jgi:dihydropyrimidine dehydrogenase (NADP+)